MTKLDIQKRPIGVFDSGLGGLTVVRALTQMLPQEDIVYLGDSARVPYGTRSPETVIRYAKGCSDFLMQKNLKMLIVACNTVSAVALPTLREQIDIPVLGVITAGAVAAVSQLHAQRIGVIGTAGTIGSGAYTQEITKMSPDAQVHGNAAPLLVPLAEEGWLEGQVPLLAAQKYLQPLIDQEIEVLLLGCTHYPLLEPAIRRALDGLGSAAPIINSATAMSRQATATLETMGLLNTQGEQGTLRFYVTDMPGSFEEVASRFLGQKLEHVELVDIS